MASTPRKTSFVPERTNYTLEFDGDPNSGGPIVVKAVLTSTSNYRWNPDMPNDPKFNLSGMLGNDNGVFKWGRAGFEQSGRNFSLVKDQSTQAFVLHGELLDLVGKYKEAEINLDEKLKVEEYVDQGSYETFHRLIERHVTPPERTLVLCFDGTSNHFSNKNTNVVKLVELLKKNDPSRQMITTQAGVGTYAPPGLMTSIGLTVAEKADEAAAWYLYQHVIDGYRYLMESYRIGDSIMIFGFSRGAFTARALAGMLHCVGLLPRHNIEQVPFAYEVYKNAKDVNSVDQKSATTNPAAAGTRPEEVDPEEFKRTFCIPVKIDFVGVWDTVASVGALFPKTLPWIEYNPSIVIFRQALALDERRGNFIPSVWDHSRTNIATQDVREVWFRGEHSDIGGGSEGPTLETGPDGKQTIDYKMLSNITLRWMIRQIIDCKTCILFDYSVVQLYRSRSVLEIPPAASTKAKWDWVNRVEASIKLDHDEVVHPIYDSIGWSPLWNTLEYMPVAKPIKTTDKFESTTTRWPNAKSGRSIYRAKATDPIFIHSSVVAYLTSQEPGAVKEGYKPRAKWYGYEQNEWPRIEDVPHDGLGDMIQAGSGFPEEAKKKLDMVRPPTDQGATGWRWDIFSK
ncbi:choline transport protein [Ceratobasidium sp. AG-Ba]|nr:choline transport protein [Ceratobasidium sp. AG-Ba]